MAVFNKDNLSACIDVIDDVVGLSKLLQKISGLLKAVQAIFTSIMEVCGDIIEKCMEFVGDLASAFAEAICMEMATFGFQNFEGVKDAFQRFWPAWEASE